MLEAFWSEVERRGTPLLEPHPSGFGYAATFLYRLSIAGLRSGRNLAKVRIAFDGDYVGGDVDLEQIPGTTVWFAEVHIPPDFAGTYCFHLWDKSGLLTEDIHQTWAMSFPDLFNPLVGREYDAIHERSLVSTSPLRGALREDVELGKVVTLTVDAQILDPPHLSRRDELSVNDREARHPVWVYLPHPKYRLEERLPCVVLMNGQFAEHFDLTAVLDNAVADGLMPPVAVITSGRHRHNQNAWGWRHGYGPPPMGRFVEQVLWPALAAAFSVRTPIHLIAFGPTAHSAVATAAAVPHLVSSVTLLSPVELSNPDDHGELLRVIEELREVSLLLGWPSLREGRFARENAVESAIANIRPDAIRLTLTDANIYSAIDAVIESVRFTCS